MFRRQLETTIKQYANFPVLAILGPRQSGKTTLVQEVFSQHAFVSLEHPGAREFALSEPEKFLATHENKHGIIIDEFQYAPALLSYIQLAVDSRARKSYFILTGSQNFLMNQAITQSLAGRVGILNLLPLSLAELKNNKLLDRDIQEVIFNGFYPRLYNEDFTPEKLYPSYLQTYVERDVRQLINVGDLSTFQKFISRCAARVGNLLNLSDLSTVCGVSTTTAKRWISLLQASYIIFLLEPHFKNFNKRLTKMPKLYFYDTGLACNLLRIASAKDLFISPYWGPMVECFVIADIAKQYYNQGTRPPIYFWRDQNGRLEIDCLIDQGTSLTPVEIKASQTIVSDFFDGLANWSKLAHQTQEATSDGVLVYTGTKTQSRTHGHVVPWKDVADLVSNITVGKKK